MKTKLIVASWLISLMLLPTDNALQALIALCAFVVSSLLLERNKVKIGKDIKSFEQRIERIINKQK